MRDLRETIASHYGTAPDQIEPGRIVRFSTNGKQSDKAGWVILFEDQAAAVFGDWRASEQHVWRAKGGRGRDAALIAAAQAARAQEEAQRHAEAAERAALIWTRAQACDAHPYLDRKEVGPDGVRVQLSAAAEVRGQFYSTTTIGEPEQLQGLLLLIPLRDTERRLWSLQAIDASGRKSFMRGGRVRGMFHLVGRALLRGAGETWTGTIAIAEGYATAASISRHQEWPVATAFCAGNLEPVARAIRARLPKAKIIVCGDCDPVGKQKANEAAAAANGLVSFPSLSAEQIRAGLTDFNDYARSRREVAQ